MNKILTTCIIATLSILFSACGGNSSDTSKTPALTVVSGESVYKRTCITCHQANGEGIANVYPPLAKSDFITDKNKAIKQVISGFTGALTVNGKAYNSTMPPQPLNDDEIAAVLTYVYSSFGNSGGAVTPADVKNVRAAQ